MSEKNRERYLRLKAAGLCVKCGKAPAAPGRGMCGECAERARMRTRSGYSKRKAAGMCVACGKAPALSGRAKCGACLEYARTYNKGRYLTGGACDGDCENCRLPECGLEASPRDKALNRAMGLSDERRAAGLCIQCGRPAEAGRSYCPACLSARREDYQKKAQARRDAGLCYLCGERPPEPGKTRCRECAEKDSKAQHRVYEGRARKGVCVSCGKAPAAEGHALCAGCIEKMREGSASRRAGNGIKPRKPPAADHPWRRANGLIGRRKEEDG